MTNLKLSQITSATANPATTDNIVSVVSGSTDNLVTYAQAASTISPLVSVSAGTQITGVLPVANGGASFSPAYLPNYWYRPFVFNIAAGSALVGGTVYLYPFFVAQPITIKALGFGGMTAAGGVSFFNMGIYSNNPALNSPSTLLANCTGSNGTSANSLSLALSSNLAITTPGWYWTALQSSDSTARWVSASGANNPIGNPSFLQVMGTSTLNSAVNALQIGFSFSTNTQTSSGAANVTLPSSVSGAAVGIVNIPLVSYQISSVP